MSPSPFQVVVRIVADKNTGARIGLFEPSSSIYNPGGEMIARDILGRFIRSLSKHPTVEDLTGQRFGKMLRVIRFCGREKLKKGTRSLWLCKCVCGNRTVLSTGHLRSGNTKSCGCLRDLEAVKRCKERITHGHTLGGKMSPTYAAFCSARQRCRDPRVRRWKSYGGANPPVRFLYKNFQEFLDEVGPRPEVEGVRYSLGRKQDTGNYGPGLGNKWQTNAEQIASRYLHFNGRYVGARAA